MKTMILFFLILLSTIAHAQFSLQPRIGLNSNKHFVAAMDIAYRFKNLEGAAIINDVQNTREPAFFGYRLGFSWTITQDIQLTGIFGHVFKYMSNDKQYENYWVWDYGFRAQKGIAFIQADHVEQFQITIGAIVK